MWTTVPSLMFFTEIITDLFWGKISLDKCCTVFHFGSLSLGTNPPNCTRAVAHSRAHSVSDLNRFCCCGAKAERVGLCPEWLFSIPGRLVNKITQLCHLPLFWGAATLAGWREGRWWVWGCREEAGTEELDIESPDEIERGCEDSWKYAGAGEPADLMWAVQH